MSNKPNLRSRAPRPQAAARRVWWANPVVWVAGLVVVALAVTIALTVGGSDEDDDAVSTGAESAFAEIIGDPLPPLAPDDPTIGSRAPVIVAQTLDGDRVELGRDGVARLYGFFAHWCPHCQAELPRVTSWLNENDLPNGVEVVAISTGLNPSAANYPPSAWFEREQFPATVVLDDENGPLAQGFGLTGFPFWVAVDADGNVAQRSSGELPISEFEALLALVDPSTGS